MAIQTSPQRVVPFGRRVGEGYNPGYFRSDGGNGFIRGYMQRGEDTGYPISNRKMADLTSVSYNLVSRCVSRPLVDDFAEGGEDEVSRLQADKEARQKKLFTIAMKAYKARKILSALEMAQMLAPRWVVSADTVRLDLEEIGFKADRAQPVPLTSLGEDWARKRLEFCLKTLAQLNSGELRLNRLVFSDESIFRAAAQSLIHWHPNDEPPLMIERSRYVAYVHFWGAITPNGKLFFGDLKSYKPTGKKGGLTAPDYVRVIKGTLMENQQFNNWRKQSSWVLMQDGAPCHKGAVATLDQMHINILSGWPPYSPCLNPIENLWSIVKKIVSERLVENSCLSNSKANTALFKSMVIEEFEKINPEYIKNLCASFKSRLEACVAAKGGHIDY